MKDYTIDDLSKLAKAHAQSGLNPRLNQAEAFCVMQKGVEAGIQPMTALQHLKVVRGNVAIYAEGMRALILGHGHRIVIEEATDKVAKITGYRKGEETGYTVTFTMKDAERAKLTGSSGKMPSQYQLRPDVMLLARATTRLGREYFADVISGLSYTPEEIEEIEGSDPAPWQPKPAQPEPGQDPNPEPESESEPAVFDGWEQVYENWKATLTQIYDLNQQAGEKCDKRLFDTYGSNLSDLAKNQSLHPAVTESLQEWLAAAKNKFQKS